MTGLRAILLPLLLVFGLIGSDPARAQLDPDAPLLRVTFDETEAIPGQFLNLRLTVLVPTSLTSPPVWPALEAANLLVRLPEGSTGPTSERINGDTWAGVTRRYRIAPMIPGTFTIPPQEIILTWRNPASGEPTRTRLATEPLAFSGIVPEGAEGLDPFIAAQSLSLSQEVEGDPGGLAPGDALTVTLTAEVGGVSPMFLPQLLAPAVIPGLAAYPDAPVLEEAFQRGVISGTRQESITYVAEGGGEGIIPVLSLQWYNIASGRIETATTQAIDVQVSGPPAVTSEPRDWRLLALFALATLLVLGLLIWIGRRIWPLIARWRAEQQERRLASEADAWDILQQALRKQDLNAVYQSLDTWAARLAGPDPREAPAVTEALLALGAGRYAAAPPAPGAAKGWAALSRALAEARRSHPDAAAGGALPPLNPTA